MSQKPYSEKYDEFGEELSSIVYQMMRLEYDKAEAKSNKPYEDKYWTEERYAPYYNYYIYTKEIEEYELGLRYIKIILENVDKLPITYKHDFPDVAETNARLLLNECGIIYPLCVSFNEIPAKIEELTETVDSFTIQRLNLAYKFLSDRRELNDKHFKHKV